MVYIRKHLHNDGCGCRDNAVKCGIHYRRQAAQKVMYTMDDVKKGMLMILVLLYIISPIVICPGPVDDVIVLLLGIAANKNRG